MLCFVIYVLAIVTQLGRAQTPIPTLPASEVAALEELYQVTGGASWRDSSSWLNVSIPPCTWHGITCAAFNDSVHVTEINLAKNHLVGVLPSDLFQHLPMLVAIQLFGNNALTGPLPDVSQLKALEALLLSDCAFNGVIPSYAPNSQLQLLWLDNNNLHGPLDDHWLDGLFNLKALVVHNNPIGGYIPSLYGLSSLNYLSMSSCSLRGPFPSLDSCVALGDLNLSFNALHGVVPSFTNNPALHSIDISHNQLQGSLPAVVAGYVVSINVSYNHFLGEIPPSYYSKRYLGMIDVSGNELSGVVSSFANDSNIFFIGLACNHFSSLPSVLPQNTTIVTTCYNGISDCQACPYNHSSSSSSSTGSGPSSSSSTGSASSSDTSRFTVAGVGVGVAVGVAVTVLLIGFCYYCCFRNRKQTHVQQPYAALA